MGARRWVTVYVCRALTLEGLSEVGSAPTQAEALGIAKREATARLCPITVSIEKRLANGCGSPEIATVHPGTVATRTFLFFGWAPE